MVLVDQKAVMKAVRTFIAEVLILHHPTTIKTGYQAVIHCGIIRQTATIINIDKGQGDGCLRTGDKARVTLKFNSHAE